MEPPKLKIELLPKHGLLLQQVLLDQEIRRAAARKALVALEVQEAAQAWGPGSATEQCSCPEVVFKLYS